MKNRYKIIISNRNIHKEIELSPEMTEIYVGTGPECEIRLRRDMFFNDISLHFIKKSAKWTLFCSDGIYITLGDVRKLMTKELIHGDVLEVRYQESSNFVLLIEFLLDFDDGKNKYERIINLSNAQAVTIGTAPSCNIVLKSPYAVNDQIELLKNTSEYSINIRRTSFGVYINGRKAKTGEILKDMDFLTVSDYFFYFRQGNLMTQIRADMVINGLSFYDRKEPENYPRFDRNTRIKVVPDETQIEILDPPTLEKKPRNNFLTRLLPAASMFIMAGAMATIGSTAIVMSVISGCMAVVTAVVGLLDGRKEYKEKSAQRIEKYNIYIADKENEIQNKRTKELSELSEIYVSADELKKRLGEFSPDLFDRRKEDADYLDICLGYGDVKALRQIKYKKQEKLEIEDELQTFPENLCKKYENVHDAPVVCDLKEINALGISGPIELRFEMLKNIVLDIVARQYYSDVKLIFIAENEHKDYIKWLRFLPHVYNDAIGTRNIVINDESKNIIFEYLYKELTLRQTSKKHEDNIIVFFFDEYGFKNHPVSRFIDAAKDLGVTFIFFGDTRSAITQGCDQLINIVNESSAQLINAKNRNEETNFSYQQIPFAQVVNIVKMLAPVYTQEISLEGSLTKNITLFELLKIFSAADLNLQSRWSSSQVFKSMAAPLGVTKSGIISLDLHDKAHGPHGLVAGTTGSGKSEVLQTYVLSMATLFSPDDVGFVIIDFKGGGMANQFRDLPHLLGAITNIDGKAINRSLKSIKAELKKRQRLFADADVNHIDAYIKKYKNHEADIALPHLIIIVDEFAELKAEQPDFMKELISAARIGRSLGVHLILATQKPAGQVDDQIWSNSRFKLCLKVQSPSDSNEVLKSPLAAEIKEAGRAYLQVGNNEIFELFQSAYSGAPERIDDMDVKEFSIYSYLDSGKKACIYTRKKGKGQGGQSQLEALVGYISGYCKERNISKLPDICLPALDTVIDYVPAKRSSKPGVYEVNLGIFDDPDNQYQGEYKIDLASNNLMIIGSAQSGKTNMLQNIIRSLAESFSPDEAVIYIMDFASMILKNFESLHHVGGVVCASEDEKLKNLFKLLRSEIESRKERLMNVGVSSFAAYKEAGFTDLPLMVVMIDNLTALKELYLQDSDDLLDICRDGLTVGISVVAANSQTSGINYRYISNFSGRIALYCNDSGEYSNLFEHCREKPDSNPGRCLVEIDRTRYECQSYLAFKGEKEIDRVGDIKKFVEETNKANAAFTARKIPVIPDVLERNFLYELTRGADMGRFEIPLGLNYESVSVKTLNMSNLGVLAISGKADSGRHSLVKYFADSLEHYYPSESKFYIIDGVSRKFKDLKDEKNVSYSMMASDTASYLAEIDAELKERYDSLAMGDEDILDVSKLLLLVIDNPDAISEISSNKAALAAYKNMIGRYKNLNVGMIVFIDNAAISFSSPDVLKDMRDNRNIIFFDDLANLKIFDAPLSFTRRFKKRLESADAYYFKEAECVKVKTPAVQSEK